MKTDDVKHKNSQQNLEHGYNSWKFCTRVVYAVTTLAQNSITTEFQLSLI